MYDEVQNNLIRASQKYLYDEVQNNQIRASHILEYSWTLYIDIFAVKMEISLKKRIASREWDVYGIQITENLHLRKRKHIKMF